MSGLKFFQSTKWDYRNLRSIISAPRILLVDVLSLASHSRVLKGLTAAEKENNNQNTI